MIRHLTNKMGGKLARRVSLENPSTANKHLNPSMLGCSL